MAKSPEELATHSKWLGYVQPVGLVVPSRRCGGSSVTSTRNIMGRHARFLECLSDDENTSPLPKIQARCASKGLNHRKTRLRFGLVFVTLAWNFVPSSVPGWEARDLIDVAAREVLHGDKGEVGSRIATVQNETLRPTHCVPVFQGPKKIRILGRLLIQEWRPART